MMQAQVALHPELETILNFAPALTELVHSEVTVVISDKERILSQIIASDLNFGEIINKPLQPKDPMVEVIRSKRSRVMTVPKEIYGVPFRGAISPLFSKSGELLGTLSINTTLSNQQNLIEVANVLSLSSEEMQASVQEITYAASALNNTMGHLATSQADMFKQVESSAKMLDMINTVAKNTRILGFNAGIEAARSGEHGRGFAVVAKEITKLADLSAQSVEEIRQLMLQLRSRVDEVKQIVDETSGISQQQFESIHEISEAMESFTAVVGDIEGLAKKV
ncbi:MAG: methyl-accepting chemotaxis protein [Solibacillus sp.]